MFQNINDSCDFKQFYSKAKSSPIFRELPTVSPKKMVFIMPYMYNLSFIDQACSVKKTTYFRLGGLLSTTDHVIFFTESCFCNPFKNDSFILHATIKYLIARILKSVITWSEMWQQTAQTKKVYWSHFFSFFSC